MTPSQMTVHFIIAIRIRDKAYFLEKSQFQFNIFIIL
jgi:hypothetical protein